MREIKFRAWSELDKEMFEVASIDLLLGLIIRQCENRIKTYVLEELVLMQYTGLKDKHGVEIYEGDIVIAWSQGYQATGEVKQRIDGLWLMYPAYQHGKQWGLCPNPKGGTTVEIIGNIYENPELLGETH